MVRRATGIVWAALFAAATVAAQREPGAVRSGVQLLLGVEESNSPPAWRIYEEPREFRLRVSLTNQSGGPIRIDQRRLRDAFVLRVSRESRPETFEEVAVRVEWLDRVSSGDSLPEPVNPDVAVQIDPATPMAWTIVVSRVDGQLFSTGRYQIERGFENVRDAFRMANGAAWSGRVPDGTAQWWIRVKPGESAAERAIPDLLAAAEAARLNDFETAIDLYTRAAATDPVNSTALLGRTDAYLHVGRYREALSLLEGIAGRPGWSMEAIAGSLTQAYVGVGNLAGAVKVLQSMGLADEEIAVAIKEMRQYVADNPPR